MLFCLLFRVQSRSGITQCSTFQESCCVFARCALRIFIGVAAEIRDASPDGKSCTLVLNRSPLVDFVKLPSEGLQKGLHYNALLCGCAEGAFQAIGLQVSCTQINDELAGDAESIYKLQLDTIIQNEYNDDG